MRDLALFRTSPSTANFVADVVELEVDDIAPKRDAADRAKSVRQKKAAAPRCATVYFRGTRWCGAPRNFRQANFVVTTRRGAC